MSCCGNKRAAYSQGPSAISKGSSSQSAARPSSGQATTGASRALTPVSLKMWTDLHFVNTGDAPLTVSGAITGRLYHWSGKGDIQVVDYRDAGAIRHQWKVLKRVR